MPHQYNSVLDESVVRAALQQAWRDSKPGLTGGYEEGGFVLQDPNSNLSVTRWPAGGQNTIALPQYTNCKIGERDIVATFHTHPNTGSEYLQEPSETDKRAVHDDHDLKGEFYEGEFVLVEEMIYLITPTGQVHEVELRRKILGAA